MARPQRILLHSFAIELLHAGYETSGKGGDRCHGQAKRIHRTHLADMANLHAHHGWNRAGDGAVPGGVAEGDDGRGSQVFDWLDRNGYSYIPSQSNCFMLDTKRPAKAAIDAMASI